MTPIARFDLFTCNTFGMHAHAAWGLPFTTLAELQALLAEPGWAAMPRLVLGGGSNVLFTCDFEGLILLNRMRGIAVREDATHWHLEVAAGENWHELVAWTLAQGMAGLENLALIPGAVGAAPVQNIGAYGIEFCRYCDYVVAWNIPEGRLETIPAAGCGFGYRESHFKGKWHQSHIITAVGLSLPKQWQPISGYGPLRELGDKPTPQQIFEAVCRLRLEKLPQPEVLGNAGSFFKNPCVTAEQADALTLRYPAMPRYPQADGQVKLAAGWLIEQAGLKGVELGRAAVHAQQALVLVNLGGATAQEIMDLARLVRQRVQHQFAVQLEPEVRFIGNCAEVTLDEGGV